METPDLPPDLRALEEALKSRRDPPHEAAARDRIMNRVRSELSRQKRTPRLSRWQFAAGLAAAVLLGLNLSMNVGSDVNSRPDRELSVVQTAAIEQLSEMLPELSDAELRQQARAMACAAPRRAGALHLPILDSTERDETWDMR